MSKHTPLTFENSGLVDCVFRGRERVAEMIGPDGESLGKLFAAAPEMLEALRDTLSWMEDCLMDRQQRGLPSREAYETVRTAIAKATAE